MSCKYDIEETPPFTATPYQIQYPPGWTAMEIPPDNPMTVEGVKLGRFLFWEKALSSDHSMSCGNCHKPPTSFSDDDTFSEGVTGELGTRQSMPLINLGWHQFFFWDGRAITLEEQILEPVENPVEMNNTWENAVADVKAKSIYPPMFEAAFGTPEVDRYRISKAIAQFIRTMISGDSKWDKAQRGELFLTTEEAEGFELFKREGAPEEITDPSQYGGDCLHCHKWSTNHFTDFVFHNNGIDSLFTDLGRGEVTGNPLDFGKFKTPTLRNIEFSGPYMHDGRFTTLEEVIDHYNSGGHPSETIDPFMKYQGLGLQLLPIHKQQLLAFFQTLTDTAFVNNPDFQDPHD